MNNRLIYWLAPLGWMSVIFYFSSQPYQTQDIKPMLSDSIDLSFLAPILNGIQFIYHNQEVSVEALTIEGFVEFFIRKGAHVTVFFILMVLIFVAIRKSTSINGGKSMVISLGLTIGYAAFDEIHQSFTPNRTPYIGDVFIDIIGAVIALIIIGGLRFGVSKNR